MPKQISGLKSSDFRPLRINMRLFPLFHGNAVLWICSGSHYTYGPTYRHIIPVTLFYRPFGDQKLVTQTSRFQPVDDYFTQAFRLLFTEALRHHLRTKNVQ